MRKLLLHVELGFFIDISTMFTSIVRPGLTVTTHSHEISQLCDCNLDVTLLISITPFGPESLPPQAELH